MRAECECARAPGRVAPLQVLERSGRDLVLSCADVIENLMGLVWSKDLKTLRYTTGAVPLRPPQLYLNPSLSPLHLSLSFGREQTPVAGPTHAPGYQPRKHMALNLG